MAKHSRVRQFFLLRNPRWGFLVLVIVGALIFRLFDWEKRTLWNVEQSLMFWQIKQVVINHKISLIGLHFFSLLHGAIYRTAIYNWIMAVPMAIFDLKVSVAVGIFAALSIASLIAVSQVALRLGGKIARNISLLLYSLSWYISLEEMKLWYAALMIPLSSAITWWLFGKKSPKRMREFFILGLIAGFGFSLHFVVVWLIGGIVIYWLAVEREKLKSKIFGIALGLLIMLSPLILFNLRHDFVMKRGLINMITSEAVEDKATLGQRLSLATQELSCVIGKTEAIGCRKAWPFFILIGSAALAWISYKDKTKKFLIFVLLQVSLAFIGIFYAGRLDYSSQHYVFYLIPLFIVVFSLALSKVWRSPYWIAGAVMIIVFLYINLMQFLSYKDLNSYFYKRELARYIYSLPSRDRIGIMFWDQEALVYDFVFYEAARDLGMPYEKVNIIERWGADEPDGYVFHKEETEAQGKLYTFGGSKLLMVNKFPVPEPL